MRASFASLVGLAALPLALAVPDVTPALLPGGCTEYPGFNAATGETYPFLVAADSTGTDIDGHSDIAVFSRGPTAIRWGQIAIAENNQVAKNPIKCTPSGLRGLVPTGVSGYTWEALVAAGIPYNAYLMYLVDGNVVEPYAHLDAAGERVPGIFLGSGNVTTWAFKRYTSAEFGNHFLFRLLGPNSQDPQTGNELFDGEFKGFIKVAA